MSDDIIERAELALAIDPERCGWRPFVVDLIAALKAERAENERLADALRERLPKSEVLGPIYVKEMADVLADAALSLPGIAIVDTDADVDWIAERMADANDGIIYGLLTPDEAEFYRRMARAALLAANAAEQESK